MRFDQFSALFNEYRVFESSLILPFYDSAQQAHRQLSDWTRAGKIWQLRRGVYAFPSVNDAESPIVYVVANRLVRPSYVSLQSALSYYGMIPEHVASVTSVTTARPNTYRNEFGRFSYRHIKTDFFFGYQHRPITKNQRAFIATPEKAILDLIHLTPNADDRAYLYELRLQNLEILDIQRLTNFVKQTGQPKLERALTHLLALIKEEINSYESL